jgi:hypothetical protein
MPSAHCPILKRVSLQANECFGSTYLSESGFSAEKILKSKYTSSRTDRHLNDCMRVAITTNTPNYKKLDVEVGCQVEY